MKNYLKVSIILIAILTVYSIIVFIVANNNKSKELLTNENPIIDDNKDKDINDDNNKDKEPNEKEENDSGNLVGDYNIILSPKTIISYKDNKWYENRNLNYTDLLFDVYVDMELLGKKYLTYNNEWYVYDENRNFSDYSGEIFAVNSSKEYRLRNFSYSNLVGSDKTIIANLLKEKEIGYNYEDMIKYKITYDINRDGTRDNLYFISNAFTENESFYNKSFSIGFAVLANETKVFYENIDELDANYSICNSYLQNILEINNNLYFITGCAYFSNQGTQHYIYNVNGTNIKQELKTSINE